jgi:hypothetical protein
MPSGAFYTEPPKNQINTTGGTMITSASSGMVQQVQAQQSLSNIQNALAMALPFGIGSKIKLFAGGGVSDPNKVNIFGETGIPETAFTYRDTQRMYNVIKGAIWNKNNMMPQGSGGLTYSPVMNFYGVPMSDKREIESLVDKKLKASYRDIRNVRR